MIPLKFIGFYNYTVILTYLSLFSGMIAMRSAHIGAFDRAILCLLLSGVCDLFDGAVARTKRNRTEDEKGFGIQLDSLCDVICFGVVPAVIMYFRGVDSMIGMAILIFYVLCAVIRLAFFNVLETKRQAEEGSRTCTKSYRGMPVTCASMIFPFFYLFDVFLPLPEQIMLAIYYVLPLVTALLFIADFPVPKLNVSKLFRKREEQEKVEDILPKT